MPQSGVHGETDKAIDECIALPPGAKRGEIAVTLHGDLGAILEWTDKIQKTPDTYASGVSVSVVAGAGFEPATFRL